MTAPAVALQGWLFRTLPANARERQAALWSFAYFFTLLAGYYVLRPLRDQMGIAGGVKSLPWLFTATFVSLLVAQPLYGALVARLPRVGFIPIDHGWVIGISLHDSGKLVSFETRARGGGIWSQGGLSVVGDELFFATGNTFGAATWSDGEAVFRVGADLRRSEDKRDYFAPSDWKTLDARDADLGGSNPLPLDFPGAGGQALMLALGKDRKAYLLDRKSLGGIGGQLAAETVSELQIVTSPVTYPVGDELFVAFQAPGAHCPQPAGRYQLMALKIAAGAPPTITTAWCGAPRGRGSPIVTTTDGYSNPIVWMLGAEGDNRLHAFRGDTGEPLFASEPLSGLRHLQTFIATQDHLYVGADGRIHAFSF